MVSDASRVKWRSRNGENRLKDLCNDAGCTSTKPEYDEYGWDIFIDTPSNRLPILSLDAQPAPIKVLCQVKTTDDILKNPISMHISNWEHLAKIPLPTFLYIVDYKGTRKPQQEYLCHFDAQRIGQTLKRLREFHSEGITKIHKKGMVFHPREEELVVFDESHDILKYFHNITGFDLNKYADMKNEIVRTIGFGNMPYKISFKSAVSISDLVDAHLGLKDIEIEDAELSIERFGIRTVEHKFNSAIAKITPSIAGKCKIIASSRSAKVRSEIDGDVYLPSINGLNFSDAKGRIVGGLLEIIVDKNHGNITFDFDDNRVLSLEDMRQNISLFYAMTQKDSRLEITSDHGRIASISEFPFEDQSEWSNILWNRIKVLSEIIMMSGISGKIELKVRDISSEINNYSWLRALLQPANINIKLNKKSPFDPDNGTSGIFATPIFVEMNDENFCFLTTWSARVTQKSDCIFLDIRDADIFDVVKLNENDNTYLKIRHDDYSKNVKNMNASFFIIREIDFDE